jgi:UDP-N-acetylglucosamine--N-acetylmuramyl-(pentapeptide) pyrophosphoryl-undecaprenol N-acetylglucosamine transferase
VRIAVTGGGTGGHVYPAIAVLEALQALLPAPPDVVWIGTKRKEAEILRDYGIRLLTVDILPPRRSIDFSAVAQNLRLAWNLLSGKAVGQAAIHLREFRPNLLIGTGAYVAYPACIAATRLKIPLYLIEPNYIPGLVTRKTAAKAKVVYCAFEEAAAALGPRANCNVTGAPIRSYSGKLDREAILEKYGLQSGRKTILVIGGSTGASFVNRAVFDYILPWIQGDSGITPSVQILHQTGKVEIHEATEWRSKLSFPYMPIDYIRDSPEVLHIADVFVGRSGANSVAEVAKFGLPSVFIPYSHHKDKQQILNAMPLAKEGLACIHLEEGFNGARFIDDLSEMLRACHNEELRKRIREFDSDAARVIAAQIAADVQAFK